MNDNNNSAVNSLCDFVVFRVAGVPLPVPPTVTNNYNTPYDATYYYYGARNPLDPNLPYNQSTVFLPSSFKMFYLLLEIINTLHYC